MGISYLNQGVGQQTPATRLTVQKAAGGARRSQPASARKRSKRVANASGAKRSKRTSAKRKNGRVVLRKGSAAAKAWGRKMAKLRKR